MSLGKPLADIKSHLYYYEGKEEDCLPGDNVYFVH